MSATLLSALTKLPMDVVLAVLEFDTRCVIRNGKLKRVVAPLPKHDSRYSTLRWMFDDHARLFRNYAMDRDVLGRRQVGTRIPIGRYKAYVVDIYDAEFYNSQTGEYYSELVREWCFERCFDYIEWVYEF